MDNVEVGSAERERVFVKRVKNLDRGSRVASEDEEVGKSVASTTSSRSAALICTSAPSPGEMAPFDEDCTSKEAVALAARAAAIFWASFDNGLDGDSTAPDWMAEWLGTTGLGAEGDGDVVADAAARLCSARRASLDFGFAASFEGSGCTRPLEDEDATCDGGLRDSDRRCKAVRGTSESSIR